MTEPRIGLFGATSFVGASLLLLLADKGRRVAAFSRQARTRSDGNADWYHIGVDALPRPGDEVIPNWICVAPIWVLPLYFDLMLASGARRVVALSSTSRYTKQESSDPAERAVADQLIEGEAKLQDWAECNGIEWVVLRPTLIYGQGRDRNVSEIASFIRRFGFFPVFGPAQGLRQPVHADDVTAACVAALDRPLAANRAYNISGGETLSYREMVGRIFAALGLRPRIVKVPLGVLAAGTTLLRIFPRYRHWTAAMAGRMSRDLVFGHEDATRDLGYAPRPFRPDPEDLSQR